MSALWICTCRYTEFGRYADISGIVVLAVCACIDAALVYSFAVGS